MGEIRHLEIDLQNDDNRSLEFHLDDNDTISFVWYTGNEGDQRTDKISIAKLYECLRSTSDWREQLKREKMDTVVKAWKDRCAILEKQKEQIKEENWQLKSQIQSLKETIKIVEQK